MIRIPCHCGRPIEVPSELAGSDIQCPDCGILNFIPPLEELQNIEADGTIRYTGGELAAKPNAARLAEQVRFFGTHRVDNDGEEIDLRPSDEDLAHVGLGEEIPIRPDTPPKIYAPMYDPETGELVRPLEVNDQPPPRGSGFQRSPHPSSAVPAPIHYVRAGPLAPELTPTIRTLPPALSLLQPANIMVMAIIFFAHVVGGLLHIPLLYFASFGYAQTGIWIPPWLGNVLFWLAVAHYANTIQETGPEASDELPRPLRMAGIVEDILAPLFRVMVAFVLCYLPVLVALQIEDSGRLVALPLLVVSAALFPAVLLTTTTSGHLSNLRPDRVMRVILQSGPKYLLLVGIWFFLFPVYLWVALGVDLIGEIINEDLTGRREVNRIYIILPIVMATVYLAHLFCWKLGLIYRERHDRFGWAWQEHVKHLEDGRRQRAATRAAKAARATQAARIGVR